MSSQAVAVDQAMSASDLLVLSKVALGAEAAAEITRIRIRCNQLTATIAELSAEHEAAESMRESYLLLMGEDSPLPDIAKGVVQGAFITCRMR